MAISAREATTMSAPRPDLPRIVWQTLRPTSWNIYYFPALASSPRQLTDGTDLDYDAVLSPDGRWVVFTSERSGNPHLYVLDVAAGGTPRLLIDSPCMEDQVAFSPDGRSIAFMSDYSGNAEIYLLPFDPTATQPLGRAKNLTHSRAGNFRPAFSPDGTRIAFSSDRDKAAAGHPFFSFARQREGDLYVMDIDGSHVRRLTKTPNWNGSPSFSPDGKTIYFYSNRNLKVGPPQSPILAQDGGCEIWAMDADGSEQRRITPAGLEALSPTVAGDRVMFTTRTTYKDWNLSSMAADGSSLRRETQGDISFWNPCFNARTGALVAHGLPPIAEQSQAVEAVLGPGPLLAPHFPIELPIPELETGAVTLFPLRHTSGLAPHPHRNEVLTTIEDEKGSRLVHAKFDGSDQRDLFFVPGIGIVASVESRLRIFDVKYSDDGELVTFTQGVFFGGLTDQVDVWRMRPDASERINLTQLANLGGRINDGMSTFSPDGKRFVFRSSRHGNLNLYLMDIDGGNVRQVTDGPWRDNFPVFSPDGREIAFSSDRDGMADSSGFRTFNNYAMPIGPDGRPGAVRRITHDQLHTSHPYYSPDGKWMIYTSERGGINDEEPVIQEIVFGPQMYGEIYAQRLSDGYTVRVTHNKWEDGPVFWLPPATNDR